MVIMRNTAIIATYTCLLACLINNLMSSSEFSAPKKRDSTLHPIPSDDIKYIHRIFELLPSKIKF